jgi:hypothetical protein
MTDGAVHNVSGRLFHLRGPMTENEQSPTVTSRDRGMNRISASADDLSQRWVSSSATQYSAEDRYCGATSCRQR